MELLVRIEGDKVIWQRGRGMGGRSLRKWCQVATVGSLVGRQLEMNLSTIMIFVFLEPTSLGWLEWKLKVACTAGLK